MVGNYFAGDKRCLVLGHDQLDITKPSQIKKIIKKYSPRAIVHLAAITNVDWAESHPGQTFAVNSVGTYNLAQLAKRHNLHLVYVSTGAVFAGQAKKPYTTDSKPKPRSIYAKSKRMGEVFVKNICPKYSIVRTGWVFGGFNKDKKFVAAIAKQIWDGVRKLKAVDDSFGCPTYGKDLKNAILDLIDKEKYGLFHAVNRGFASRYTVAKEIVKNLGEKTKVYRAKSSDFPSFIAPRPKFEVIAQNLKLRSWKSALREYLTDWQDLKKPKSKKKSLLLKVSKKELSSAYYQKASQKKVAQKVK